jgi:periplasmic copper chaperone A
MRRIILELSAAIALTLCAILASAAGASASDLMVSAAYARASATPVAKSGAAYLTIMNHGAAPDRLLAILTPVARSAQLHRTVAVGEVMKMEAVDGLDIPAGAMIEMAPGGLHVMLMGLSAPLTEGAKIDAVLVFEKAGEVKVQIPIGAVAADGHAHASGDSGG